MKTLLNTPHTKIIVIEGKEMIERPIASAMLAIDKDGDVIMVEQERGAFGKILEVPAGKVDKGEDPMKTAMREFEEETGYKAKTCHPLINYYPSVGYSTEQINCYYTENFDNTGKTKFDKGEKIRTLNIKLPEIVSMISNGEIKDSKTIMCVYSYLTKPRAKESEDAV